MKYIVLITIASFILSFKQTVTKAKTIEEETFLKIGNYKLTAIKKSKNYQFDELFDNDTSFYPNLVPYSYFFPKDSLKTIEVHNKPNKEYIENEKGELKELITGYSNQIQVSYFIDTISSDSLLSILDKPFLLDSNICKTNFKISISNPKSFKEVSNKEISKGTIKHHFKKNSKIIISDLQLKGVYQNIHQYFRPFYWVIK